MAQIPVMSDGTVINSRALFVKQPARLMRSYIIGKLGDLWGIQVKYLCCISGHTNGF